jgi:hypothetical protein
MHLACAVGTPVVSLFMGPALFYQTGPYGEGHLVLQAEIPCAPCNYLTHCSHQVCKDHIRWEAVSHLVQWALAGKPAPSPEPVPGIGAYISGYDEDGYLSFSPLTKRQLDWPAFMRLAYREVWKVILDGKPLTRACTAVTQEIARHYEWEKAAAEIVSVQEETAGDLDHLHALAQKGQALTLELVEQARRHPAPVERIRSLGKAIEEVDEQLRILGATKDTLKPIIATCRFGKENLQGWELLSLAQQTLQVYGNLAHQTKTMAQVLATSMKELFASVTTTTTTSL